MPAPFGPSTPTMPRSTSKLTAARALTVSIGKSSAEEPGRRAAPETEELAAHAPGAPAPGGLPFPPASSLPAPCGRPSWISTMIAETVASATNPATSGSATISGPTQPGEEPPGQQRRQNAFDATRGRRDPERRRGRGPAGSRVAGWRRVAGSRSRCPRITRPVRIRTARVIAPARSSSRAGAGRERRPDGTPAAAAATLLANSVKPAAPGVRVRGGRTSCAGG